MITDLVAQLVLSDVSNKDIQDSTLSSPNYKISKREKNGIKSHPNPLDKYFLKMKKKKKKKKKEKKTSDNVKKY